MLRDIHLRRLTKDDVAGADALRRNIGWNQTPSEWLRYLELSPQGCFVAVRNDFVVGTVTSLTYDETLSWVGMMLVHPDYRRQGIAQHLLSKLLTFLNEQGIKCIKLDATPMGFSLYKKLGFVTEWTFARRQGSGKKANPSKTASAVRDLCDADWPAVEEIDRSVLGVSRSALLRILVRECRRAIVWPSKGRVAGWGLLRKGANMDYIGPVVCSDNDGAVQLVEELLTGSKTPSVFWDVPDDNPAAVSAAERLGFSPLRTLTRMRLGLPIVKSDPLSQFAIADPSYG